MKWKERRKLVGSVPGRDTPVTKTISVIYQCSQQWSTTHWLVLSGVCLWSSPRLASEGKVLGEIRGLLHFAIGIRYCLFILWFLTLVCIKACISCRWRALHYIGTCRCPWQDWSRAELSRWSPRHNDRTLPCVGQTCNPSLAKSLTACIGRRPLYLLRLASTPGELCRLGAKSGVQGWVG